MSAYGRPGVQATCLMLQDTRGADVNLLLLCGWLARQPGLDPPWDLWLTLSETWQARLRPLRALRRGLSRSHSLERRLRDSVLALELCGERLAVAAFWQALPPATAAIRPEVAYDPTRCLALLEQYVRRLGLQTPPEEPLCFLATALD